MLTCTFNQGPRVLPATRSLAPGLFWWHPLLEADPPRPSCCCCHALRLPAAMPSSCSPVCSRPAQHGMGAAAAHHSKQGAPAAAGPAQTAQTSRTGGTGAAAGVGTACSSTAAWLPCHSNTQAPAGAGAPHPNTARHAAVVVSWGLPPSTGSAAVCQAPMLLHRHISIYLSPFCADS